MGVHSAPVPGAHRRCWSPAELARSTDPLWPPQLPGPLAPWRGTAGRATVPDPVDAGYVPNAAPGPHDPVHSGQRP
ncbi:hypothetical protein [Streptomyces inhibens]|uniref:hypothetical protein n=1 Tax=Streptomyces inhibens TaxID=2293571 RepID=UPI001EE6E295|nr:hypothetical protein [Streptomyces inhibens]UKY53540.1 hypothetical protein KI385_35215 [Streptomyces inhibens]